jgi:hydrogenase-4 component B
MDQTASELILVAAIFLGVGAVGAGILPNRMSLAITVAAAAFGALLMLATGVILVTGHAAFEVLLYRLYPFGVLTVRADSLSGVFLLLIGGLTFGTAVYTWSYMQRFSRSGYRTFGVLLQLMLLATLGIVLANDLILFLMAWETMSIVSYLLVTYEHEQRAVSDAGFLMLAMSQLGTALFLIGLLILSAHAHSASFDAIRTTTVTVSPAFRGVAFMLLFIGFGTKGGIVPLHVWLPEAHPAAPSNISALLSAVIVNMGVYGVFRFCTEVLGKGPSWWGFTVIGFGAVSAIIGILYAVTAQDIKRFLAYSTVENVGIIFIGLGAALIFASYHQPVLAALATMASLLHTVNHATYKGLLFLGAGAIDYATHIRDMDRLGGLIRFMPWTAILFLIGTLSIAAIPPFNGFVSEWLTLETLLQSFHILAIGPKIGIAMAGVFLALTAGLAVTAFAKAYGITFLGMPRSDEAKQAREVPSTMIVGVAVLSVEALALGVLPTAFIPWFAQAATLIYETNITDRVVPPVATHPSAFPLLVHLGGNVFGHVLPAQGLILMPGYATFSAVSPTYLAISFVVCISTVLAILWYLQRVRAARTAEVWAGGLPEVTANYQYTASSYVNPIRLIFSTLYRPGTEAQVRSQYSQYFRITISYRGRVVPVFERYLYQPILAALTAVADRAKVFQSGNLSLYLAYIFIILIVVLLFLR